MTGQLSALIADLLRDCGHPDIAGATVTATGVVQVQVRDGSAVFLRVAHEAPVADPAPPAPSWPGATTAKPAAAGAERGRRP